MAVTAETRQCLDMHANGYDSRLAGIVTWDALLTADVVKGSEFKFAAGSDIFVTLNADVAKLYSHQEQLDTILGLYATHPCIQSADALFYVPNGPRDFTSMLARKIGQPVVHSKRRDGSTSQHDFEFSTALDKEMAASSNKPVIVEDFVFTLGSVAAMRKLFAEDQDVHSVAMLLSGQVDPRYQIRLVDHYLLEK